MQMNRYLKSILAGKHIHKWETTHVNGWYMPTQEFCRVCGEYRHKVLVFGKKEPPWSKGKHPCSNLLPKKPDHAEKW